MAFYLASLEREKNYTNTQQSNLVNPDYKAFCPKLCPKLNKAIEKGLKSTELEIFGMNIKSESHTKSELINEYNIVFDQNHANCFTFLKERLSKINDQKNKKLRAKDRKKCHKILFDILQITYQVMQGYANFIYDQCKANESDHTMGLCKSFLRKNYPLFSKKYGFVTEIALNAVLQNLPVEDWIKQSICTDYINQLMLVFWAMVYQGEANLTINPIVFEPTSVIAFDVTIHDQRKGSQKGKGKDIIDYCVFPVIVVIEKTQETILEYQKIRLITKKQIKEVTQNQEK